MKFCADSSPRKILLELTREMTLSSRSVSHLSLRRKLPYCLVRTLTTLFVCVLSPLRFSQELGDIGLGLLGVRARRGNF